MAGARQFPQTANGDGVGSRQWPPSASSGGGGVTPGSGSSGFTDPRIIVSNGGALDDNSPAGTYELVANAGTDVYLRASLDAGGLGSIFAIVPYAPATAGQAGYDVEMDGGAGAAGSGATAGGAGGLAQFYGGFGGAGTALAAAGRGGDVYITSGPAGANNGGGGARGGDVFIDGSEGTGGQRSGDVVLGETTVGVWGTRYVRVGPAAGTIPLLVNIGAPVSGELLNVAGNTDALSLLGRAAIGSWVAATSCCFGHYAFRATATGYMLRGDQSGAATVLNVPTSGTLYFAAANVLGTGWRIDFTTGAAHFLPGTTAAFDIGSSSLGVRDIYNTRDVIGSAGAAHVHYVATAAAASGTSGGAGTFRAGHGAQGSAAIAGANGGLGTFSGGNGGDGATGRSPGSGGGAYLFGGDAGTRVDTGNPNGGGIEIRGGVGRQAGSGGTVAIYAGASGTGGTAGNITLETASADGTYGRIVIGTSTSQRVGFYGVTGVAQQASIANADGTLADITTKFNTLLSYLDNLGLTA